MGQRCLLLLPLLIAAGAVPLLSAHGDSCPFSTPASPEDHHHHHHDHHHHDGKIRPTKLPEELAEEEDLKLDEFDHHHHHHHHSHGDRDRDRDHDLELSPIGIWVRAMGCSLLVSMASLICLTILPLIFVQGKPSKAVVDSLALFGAGAMLGDAFLHQLPHAFGGEHSHSHDHHMSSLRDHHLEHGHSHAHSLEDLSVGLAVLCGIVLFFLVEKVVRYVEGNSIDGTYELGPGHHHHKRHNKLKDDDEKEGKSSSNLHGPNGRDKSDTASQKKLGDDESGGCLNGKKRGEQETLLHKRMMSSGATIDDGKDINAGNGTATNRSSLSGTIPSPPPSSLVFGYLNLFSDGVHNFTDGMALGSAFLLHGPVGGWSRTVFLLAHELPQEVGDFGILVRSGFTVSKALFFNFLSALVALVGTALALALGKDPGHSSWIEGFTAGGFIYIAVAGVVPEMNDGKTTFKSTALQLTSLLLGMAVALCISLVE